MKTFKDILSIIIVSLIVAASAHATTLIVTSTADSGAGTLRNLVASANPDDTITFANTLSGQTILLTSGQIVLSKDVTIDGSTLASAIQLNGNGSNRIFSVNSGVTATLNKLTVTNGWVSNIEGGNGVNNYGTLTLNQCSIVGNGNPNSVGGGGLWNQGVLALNNCIVANNSGYDGGGIYNASGTLTVNYCTLANNSAGEYGGGIINYGTLNVNECTVAGNSCAADGGAGIDNESGNTTVSQSTISGNTASHPSGTGGIFKLGTVTIYNSIVAGNSAAAYTNLFGTITTTGANLTNGAPLLAILGNYGGPTPTMPPLPGSPAIDGCTGGTTFASDQRGLSRLLGPSADIGAVESGNPVPGHTIVTTTSDTFDGFDVNGVSLREAAAFAPANATVTFTNTLSGQTILLTSGEIVLSKNVTIDGSALTSQVQLNGNNASRLFFITNGTVTLNALTLTNGSAMAAPAYTAGGAAVANIGTLTVTNCLFTGNTNCNEGGAIYCVAGSLTLERSTFAGNACNVEGGAIRNVFVPFTARQCTFTGNHSVEIAGACSLAFNPAATLVNCTIVGNSAGGGIRSGTAYGGGGLLLFGSTVVNLTNCIVAGNSSPAGYGIDLNVTGSTLNLLLNLVGNNDTVATIFPTGPLVGTNGAARNPLLAPLGNYGGPTPTMPPLPGSPAINGCTSGTSFTTDQRGLPRIIGSFADIGAVEANLNPVVINNNDSGSGSLRQTVAEGIPGATITFTNTLFGQTILLTSGEIAMSKSMTVDGSTLSNAVTVSGNNNSRVFNVNSGAISLIGLTLTGGNAVPGGAIYTASGSTLSVLDCTLTGNNSTEGGAILNDGTLSLLQCTLAGNHGTYGGAFQARFNATVAQCTIASNTASYGGGGIFAKSSSLNVSNSIVAGNSANTLGGDIYVETAKVLTYAGPNLISGVYTQAGATVTGPAPITLAPLLAPLGNYGGPTPTMPPLPGSPAIDAGSDTATNQFTTDQRGFARKAGAHVDIGAVEGVYVANYTGPGKLKNATRLGDGSFRFGFTNYTDMSLTVWASTNVALPFAQWSNLGAPVESPAGTFQFTDPHATNTARRFYRVSSP